MGTDSNEIIVTNSLNSLEIPKDYMHHYFTHILCHSGSGQFRMENKDYKIVKNDIVIWLPTIQINDLMFSPDFTATYLLVSFDLMSKNNPDIGWGIKGYLFSKENPVIPLSENDANKCLHNFVLLKDKNEESHHRFQAEMIKLQLQLFVIEMWNIFADRMEQRINSNEKGSLFERFLQMVQVHCMENREVDFYSDKLFITSKYLSEICKKNSGKTASEWIQNYTTQRLIILLRNPNLNFTEIADTLNFSSQSFFSRYVRKALGVSPSEYRERLRD